MLSSSKNRTFWSEFLELYKSLPALWKVKSEEYNNRILKNSSYEKLIVKMKEIEPDANREMVVKKINTFRTNFRRELRKMENRQKSGAGDEAIFQSTLWYFDLMCFLEDQEDCLEGRSTIESNDENAYSNRVNDEETYKTPEKKARYVKEEDNLTKLDCDHLEETNALASDGKEKITKMCSTNTLRTFWTEFLEMYKSLPALWKVNSEEYRNRVLKNRSYEKLIDKLKEIEPDANKEMVTKKISYFRTNFRRDLRKMKESLKSGVGDEEIFQPTTWYFDLMCFIEDQEDCLEERSTIESNDENAYRNRVNDEETYKTPEKKARYVKEEDNLIKLACEHLKETNNDANILAKGWASQYAEMSGSQKILARKIISDVLFHGCLGHLNENAVHEIQNILLPLESSSYDPLSLSSYEVKHEF